MVKNKRLSTFLLLVLFLSLKEISFPQDKTDSGSNDQILLQDTTLANKYFEKGDSLASAAQYDSSNFYFEQAKKIYQNVNSQISDDNFYQKIFSCENKIGRNLIFLGQYNSAIQNLTNTLSNGLNILGKNNVEVANSYDYLGSAYRLKGDYNKSMENYQNAISIMIKVLGGDSPNLATTYNSFGILYWNMGDYDKALEYVNESLSIKLSVLGNNEPSIGDNYNIMGIICWNKGDYDKALEYYRMSLSIWLRLLGKNHPNIANSYGNIGIVYYNKGEYDLSLEYYKKALSLWLKLLGKDHPNIAYIYNNIAIDYAEKGDYDSSLDYFQKSLDIRLPIIGEENSIIVITYTNFGDLYLKKENYEKALEYYNKALTIGLKVMGSHHPSIAELYYEIATIEYKRADFYTSLKNCQHAIKSLVNGFISDSTYINPSLDHISSEVQLLNVLALKAKVLADLSDVPEIGGPFPEINNLKMALSTYQLAVELIDKIRVGYKAEGSKLFLGEHTFEIYNLGIQTSLRLYKTTSNAKYKEQAFLFAEKSKAAVLQEGLTDVQAKQFAKIPVELLDKEKQLRKDLAFYNTQLQDEHQKKDADSSKVNEYQNHLFDLQTRYDQLISQFEKDYPDYYNLKYQTNTASVLEIQNQLPVKTTLIEYFVGDSSIYIFTISKDDYEIYSVKKPSDFPDMVKGFYSSILKSDTKRYIATANDLSKILIFPVLKELKRKENLVIIPHDLLYKIPFEALFTSLQKKNITDYSNFSFLIKKYNISYHYSSTLYINSLKEESKLLAGSGLNNEKNFIGFAPIFPQDDLSGYTLASKNMSVLFPDSNETFRSTVINGKNFEELKYSEWEVKSIIKLFAGNKDKTSLGYFYSDATENAFKSSIKNFNIVHIASHSFINEDQPQISGIVFAQPTDSTNTEDGILYAGETYNLDLNADLVVLSSCESGLGKLIRGEGMMALTRGFLYSGVANIIFSLWKIPDKPTSELMIEFYKQMLSGKSYSESLRQAKLNLIKNEITARPRSWASFVLVGAD